MIKKRRLIGVIISEVEGLYQHKLIKGIITQSYALNYDVAIFSTLIKNTGWPEYKAGEKNIYNLINFDLFDGIIVAGATLVVDNLRQDIEDMLLAKCKCPVVFIDDSSKHYPYIYTNDFEPMEQMTDHLIDEHGVTDIYCLAANPEALFIKNRVQGIRASLKKHGMVLEDENINYGGNLEFSGGEKLARDIISGKVRKPQAIICLNDHMAIGLVNELTKHGIHVPKDILVTGYDATDEAAFCSTVITTYSAPVMQAGARTVCELTKLMTGEQTVLTSVNQGHMEIGRSCGCYDIDYMKRSSFHRLKKKNEDYMTLLDSYMMETLTVETDFQECIRKFSYYLYLIRDYSDYYLCLCDNWDGSAHNYAPDKEITIRQGYTEKMTLVMANENHRLVEGEVQFSTKEMLPDLWKDRPKPKAYFFTPIHFNDSTIGYSVLSYGDKVKVFDITYRNWSRYIMNILEFNRVHRKLYRTSFRDVLTGIYNRRGIDQHMPNLINDAISQNKKLMVLIADLDNLKLINDQFGHKEGDQIITTVANAFQSCSRGNEICARTGGDEFIVIGVDEDNSMQERYVTSVMEYINNYNNKSKKPYNIEISIGSVSDYITDDDDIKIMMDRADHIMYKNKAINKRNKILSL